MCICLLACAQRSMPMANDSQSDVDSIVQAVLTNYASDACIVSRSLTIPTISLGHFTELGLSESAAQALTQSIANQSQRNWKEILKHRFGDQGDCLSISYPMLYGDSKFAYIIVADLYGQYEYIYEYSEPTWRLYRTLSISIH